MQLCFSHIFRNLRAVARQACFPFRCCGCGRLYRPQRPGGAPAREGECSDQGFIIAVLTEYLCNACIRTIETVRSPFCTHCGRPFNAPLGVNHNCERCQNDPFDFTLARCMGLYDHALKTLICMYKYQYRSELAAPLSRLLWQTFRSYWDPDEIDCIIPVPLHRRRMRERGFNQAELMIRHWQELDCAPKKPFDGNKLFTRILMRHRYTQPQTGLDSSQRSVNMLDAFSLIDPAVVQGRRVLLVDDVLTTGATANACARVLCEAKADSVSVLTLARAL